MNVGETSRTTFRKNTGFEMNSLQRLIESKERFRRRMRELSPTEKIQRLEMLQRRYYSMLIDRERNGGRAIPAEVKRWAEAQREIGFEL